MALLKAQFISGGVGIGNVFVGIPTLDGVTQNITLSGNPGITDTQLATAKLRVWVDYSGPTCDFSLFDISTPVIAVPSKATGDCALRGNIGSRNRRPSP